jgi:hypothetical protein
VDGVWALIDEDLAVHQLVARSLDVWEASGAESVRIAWTLAALVAGFAIPRPSEDDVKVPPPPALPPAALLAFAEPDWDALRAAQNAWGLIVGSGDHDGSAVVGPVVIDQLRRFAQAHGSTGLLMIVAWCRLLREQLAGTRAGQNLDELLEMLRTELWHTSAAAAARQPEAVAAQAGEDETPAAATPA